ncbi:hypothetical protein LZK98_05835 [Sphingomonas cannabina]|uniref:hypothetical protein n=1 Tax=Sphingomonas cannabina TaxID=2899123 RepID=UPI001F453A13|nr:hypothetical protein [Sphingomonas cannabina]UIJ46467.1 hypothetical protein LZK98_05835 [Sphingomonas cannabina]
MRLEAIALCALLVSTGVSAQSVYGPPPPGARLPGISMATQPSIERETSRIRSDIRHGRDSGALTKRESRHLRREADQIDTLAGRYGADGLSDSESRELDMRVRALRDITNAQRTMGSGSKR